MTLNAKALFKNSFTRALKERMRVMHRYAEWRVGVVQLQSARRSMAQRTFQKLLIVPSDAWLIVGSRGDDAMVTTVIAEARKRNPTCEIGIVCVKAPLPAALAAVGAVPEAIWNGVGCLNLIETFKRYDSLIVIGADVMDGHFSAADAVRSWTFGDLAARAGLRSAVIGFSFSSTPALELKTILGKVSPSLRICARDAISQKQFQAFTPAHAQLVADSAFLLTPIPTGPDQAAVESWCAAQRAAGRFICAFNTHPMIYKNCDPEKVKQLNALLVELLSGFAECEPVSFLLIPHDFRDETRGDNASLTPLNALLAPALGDRLMFARSECRAAELKALVGCADLLITGRMHLGVGALSMGVPIWAINPQDKFIGLFAHFGLPDLRIEPVAALDRVKLKMFLAGIFANWESVRDQVREKLPEVHEKAMLNFKFLE